MRAHGVAIQRLTVSCQEIDSGQKTVVIVECLVVAIFFLFHFIFELTLPPARRKVKAPWSHPSQPPPFPAFPLSFPPTVPAMFWRRGYE